MMITTQPTNVKCGICGTNFVALDTSVMSTLKLCECCLNCSSHKEHLYQMASHNVTPIKYVNGTAILKEADIDKVYCNAVRHRCILCKKDSDLIQFNHILTNNSVVKQIRILICKDCLDSSEDAMVVVEQKTPVQHMSLKDYNNRANDRVNNLMYANEVDLG